MARFVGKYILRLIIDVNLFGPMTKQINSDLLRKKEFPVIDRKREKERELPKNRV